MSLYRRFVPYVVAIGLTAIAFFLSFWLEPLLDGTIGAFFYIAIILSTWYGGFRAGVVAVVLSTLAIDYAFISPKHQFILTQPQDLLRLTVFLIVALIINLLNSYLLESKKKIERLNQQLAQENAEQLRMARSAAQIGMWGWNILTGELKASPEAEQLSGWVPGTFDQRYETFLARLHPEDLERFNQAISRAIQVYGTYQCEYRIIWPDGSIHWLEGRGRTFSDQTGQAVRMMGTIMNIDERKQTEALLHQQFLQQRLVMEITQHIRQSLNLPDILQTTVEEVRQFLHCDRVIVFQFSPGWGGKVVVESVAADWMALLPLQIYDPCISEEYVEPLKQGVVTVKSDIYNSGLSPCHIEFLASFQVKANLVAPILMGNELWGLLAAHHCEAPRQWLDSEVDLLRQVALQAGVAIQQASLLEQTQKAAVRIQMLFNTSFDGVVILDRQGKVLDANPRFAQMLGYTPEEITTLTPFDWDANFTPEELQQIMDNFTCFHSGVFETRHRRKDGSIFDVEISANVVECQGELLRFCVCRDITERKHTQTSLLQLNLELEQRVLDRTGELSQTNILLQQSQTQFQYLVANVPGGIYTIVYAPDGSVRFDYVSPAFSAIFELESEQILNDSSLIFEQFYLEDIPVYNALLAHSLQTLETFDHELRIITPSGRLKWLHVRAVPHLQADGSIIKYGIIRDITERKQIEESLAKTLQQLSFHIENTPLATIIWDSKIRVQHWSKQAEKIFGWTMEEVFGKTMAEWRFIFEADQEKVNLKTETLFRGQSTICRNRNYRKDGTVIDCEWYNSALLDESGNLVSVLSFAQDITQRNRLEQALKVSEEKYRQIIDLANEGVWIIDTEGYTTFVNPRMAEMLGYTVAEMMGQSMFAFMDEEELAIATANLEARRRGITEQHDFKFRCKDGSELWCIIGTSPIVNEGGQFMGALGMITDISDRKRIEKALLDSEEKFRQLAENIQAVFWMTDVQNQQLLYVSHGYETLWQRHCEDIYQNFSDWLNAVYPEDRPQVEAAFMAQKTIGYSDTEYRIVRPDGSLRWIRDRAFPIRDEAGNILRIAGIAEDITERKQAEESLQQSESILRSFFNSGSMMMGIVEIYPHDIFHLSSNFATTEFFSLEFDTMQSQFASEIGVPQEHIEMWLDYYREAERKGSPVKFEYRHQTATTQKWLSATVCPIVSSPTQKSRFSFVVEDITERKQAEEALRQKSRKEELLFSITQAIRQSLDLHAILNTAVTEVRHTLQTDRAAIYQFNPDWSGDFVVESVAPGWIKLVEDNVQKSWEDTYLQDTQGGRFRDKQNFIVNDIYLAGLQPCHIELLEQFQAKSYAIFPIFLGETVWGLLAIYQNSTSRQWQSWEIELLEQIASQLSIAIQQSDLYRKLRLELQERKQAEAVLREAERRWRSLLDNVHLIVVGLDQRANINYVNPFFLGLTGYTEAEVLGQNWLEKFIPNKKQESIQLVFSEILTDNYHPYYQNTILTKCGEERFIAWNNTVLQNLQGKIIGMISIGEDITERQRIEQIKDEFIGIVSHELRTPLTAIQMSLGLLNTGIYDQKPEKYRRMIEIALLDTKRLVNLVNDILDLERLESGRAILDKTVCKAIDLMQQAVDGIKAIASQEQISLVILPSDAEVWAAEDAVIQVLTNLLSNAIKFSPTHSRIDLSAEPQADCVLFKVSDHGRGIPADKLEVIFGRFQQVDGSDSREKGGTGLGLAICRSIIEQHGGRIWAESILNEGSTFFFTLPLPVKP